MYKLVITKRPGRKVEYKHFWMTQEGIYQAEDKFQELQNDPDVLKLELWRQDLHGIFVLDRWRREE